MSTLYEILTSGVALNRSSPLAVGLRIWYPFAPRCNEQKIFDYSGNGYHLTYQPATGTPAIAVGPRGRALNATGSYSWKGTDNVPMKGNVVTMAMWWNFTASRATFEGGFQKSAAPGALANNDWGMIPGNSDTETDFMRSGSASAINGISSVGDKLIVYVIAENVGLFYVNGALVDSGAGVGTGATSNTASRFLWLSASGSGVKYGDIAVWDRALSPWEVFRLYDPRTRYDLYKGTYRGGTTYRGPIPPRRPRILVPSERVRPPSWNSL